MARAEAYPHAKFDLDPSNRLATIHQRYSQDYRTGQRSDSIGRTVLQTVAKQTGGVSWSTLKQNSGGFASSPLYAPPVEMGHLLSKSSHAALFTHVDLDTERDC